MFEYRLVKPGSDFETAYGLAEITSDRPGKRIGPNVPYSVAIDTDRRYVVYMIWHGDPLGGHEYEVKYVINMAGSAIVAHCTTQLQFTGAPNAWRFVDNGLPIPPDFEHSRSHVIATLVEALEAERKALGVSVTIPYGFK